MKKPKRLTWGNGVSEATKINRFGLSRHILEEVKLEVRKRCGFGCVSCGRGIIQYDHFDPEFVDATEHNASGITLLCGSCHDEKKHNLLSNSQVAALNADPFCLKKGNAFGRFRLTSTSPVVRLGTSEFRECKVILEVAGERVLWFTRPDDPAEGIHLNARFRDEFGKIIFEIRKNEWTIGDEPWDISTSGNGVVIRSRERNYSLILRFLPPETLVIERAKISHRGTTVEIRKDGSVVDAFRNSFSGCSATNCHTGIRFEAPGNIGFGCGRPSSLDFLIRLGLTTALTQVANLSSRRRSVL
jgi:hypothetical protein